MKSCKIKHAFDDTEVEVKVGDYVGFKSDIEQYGKIEKIMSDYRGVSLRLSNVNGFEGHYIGGQMQTTEAASDCWVE